MIKQRIVTVRLRMALAASRELTLFYWELGAMIAQKQTQSQWGDKLIAQLSTDLQKAFPDIKGLSASNLKYCLRFFQFYTTAPDTHEPANPDVPFGQQPVDQIPWGHNIQLHRPPPALPCPSWTNSSTPLGPTSPTSTTR